MIGLERIMKNREDYTREEIENAIEWQRNQKETLRKVSRNLVTKHNLRVWDNFQTLFPNMFCSYMEFAKSYFGIKQIFCICGKRLPPSNTPKFKLYCSKECRKQATSEKMKKYMYNIYKDGGGPLRSKEVIEKRRKTNLEKYGCVCSLKNPDIEKKTKQTKKLRYGDEKFTNREKAKQTQIERYGGWASQTEDFRNRCIETSRRKYGTDNPMGNEQIKQKAKRTFEEKYGKHPKQVNLRNMEYFTKDYILEHFVTEDGFDVEAVCDFFHMGPWLACYKKSELGIDIPNKRNLKRTQSTLSKYLKEVIKEEILENYRKLIPPKEVDIYIPEKKLAIEYDGLLFHSMGYSNIMKFNREDFDKSYHLKKTDICEEHGVQLLHVFENEWLDRNIKEIWKSVILNKLGYNNIIYARHCEIRVIPSDQGFLFEEENHLQGGIRAKITIGLFYRNELVQVISFGKSRYDKKYEWELLRLCSKKFFNIVGGASKLFKYFIRNYNPESIISYANRRWSNGNIYKILGFEYLRRTTPNYFYFLKENYILLSRIQFQKYKLKDKLEKYDESLTETENMLNNGYRKIYDCGNLVYVWHRNSCK